MKRNNRLLLLLVVFAAAGCSGNSDWTAPGPNNWARVGPCEMCVESVRVGKLRGRTMFGSGESKEDLLQIRTRIRVKEEGKTVKLSSWQHDGGGISFSNLKLKDDKGADYKGVFAWGVGAQADGRLKSETVLKSGDPPAADLLTFEATAGQADVLLLELPARWFVPADQAWAYNPEKGSFRFRIPKSFWENAPPEKKGSDEWPVGGPGLWHSQGGFALSIQEVKVAKVKIRQMMNKGESKDDVLSIKTLLRYTGDKPQVRVGAWQSDGGGFGTRDGAHLEDEKHTLYPPVLFGMMASVEGRMSGYKELTPADPPLGDLLTFEGKAAAAAELFLELPLSWSLKDGADWRLQTDQPRFKVRLPRALWEAKGP